MRGTTSLIAFVVLLPAVSSAAQTGAQCEAAEYKAAAAEAKGELACYATAAKKSILVDTTCITAVQQKFMATYAKIIAKGGCFRGQRNNSGDVDSDVTLFIQSLNPAIGACLQAGSPCSSPLDCCSGICSALPPDTFGFCV